VTAHHINEHSREKLFTANENGASRTAIRDELDKTTSNEMDVQQLRQCEWMIKSGHFGTAEYKATSEFQDERKGVEDQHGQPTQPIAEAPTPTPPALSFQASQVSPKSVVRCADVLLNFCLICCN
jgi:hypothetical protein